MGKAKPSSSAPKEMDVNTLHRKLEPIYELIDGGNDKAALKTIDRELLGKFPQMQIGRVLKGIVLSRLGKDGEGLALCEAVRHEGPGDDNVLHTLSLFYKNTGRREESIAMFERASDRDPKNELHLTSLFQAYARDRSFVKQQGCAMKLYRVSGDKKHIMWAVCGALLQTRDDETSDKLNTDATKTSLLQLASVMCAKLEKDGSIDDREALVVYARVLRNSGKQTKALELLESALGERCVPMASERKRLCALQAAACGGDGAIVGETPGGKFRARALKHWRSVLETAPDDWEAMLCALDIAMPGTNACVTKATSPPAGGAFMNSNAHRVDGALLLELDEKLNHALTLANTAEEVLPEVQTQLSDGRALVDSLRRAADTKGGANSSGRGPYLLPVELAFREAQLLDGSFAELADAVLGYWREFGAWTSCARDLAPYAGRIRDTPTSETHAFLVRELKRNTTETALCLFDTDADETTRANRRIRRTVSAESILSTLGVYGGSWRDGRGVVDESMTQGKCVTDVLGSRKNTSSAVRGLSRPSLREDVGLHAARTFVLKYRRARNLVPENHDPREPTPGDTFALLGIQALAAEASSHAANKSADAKATTALLAAAALAEEALLLSPNHAELRIGLASVYLLLGAATASSDALSPLDIKNIQMDTMAHHALPAALGGAAPNVAISACRLADRLRGDAWRDIAEAQVKAYENGVYTKALEFVDFHARLRDSHSLMKFREVKAGVELRESLLAATEVDANKFPLEIFETLSAAVTEVGLIPNEQWANSFRYNEDVTLNPTWCGPYHGAAGLSACDWWESRREADADSTGILSEKAKMGGVPVAGPHDLGIGFGVSVAHRHGWSLALHRRIVEMHALRAAAKMATTPTDVTFETEIAGVVAAIETLATRGDGAGETCARALAPATEAADIVSDAGLSALAGLLGLCKSETKKATDASVAARSLETYADAFSQYCKRASFGLTGDSIAEFCLVERAAARGAIPAAFHAAAEAGATATITLRAYAAAANARGKLNVSDENRSTLSLSVKRACEVVSLALRELADAASATAVSEGKEADSVAETLDEWFRDGDSTENDGKALRRESCVFVAKRVVASHRVTLNAIKAHCESFDTQLAYMYE